LEACLQQHLADPEWSEYVGLLLKDGWWRAAHFCSYNCQMDALGLRPWESPLASGATADAVMLAEKLIARGISRYVADPAAALARAETRPTAGRVTPAKRTDRSGARAAKAAPARRRR